MRTYVINLLASADRRSLMLPQLEASGLDYEFVDAVDGRALSATERTELVDEEFVAQCPEWLTPGAIGCALSHRHVYELIGATGDPAALVLEDDAVLPDGFSDTIAALTRELTSNEVMLLNFRSFEPFRLTRAGAVSVPGYELVSPVEPRQALSSLAYLVGRDAAASLCAAIVPVRLAADSWGDHLARGAIGSLRVVMPQPVNHHVAIESTLGYGQGSSLRRGLKAQTIWPIPQLRAANRARVARRMARVEYVD